MRNTRGIALASLFVAGIALSGCESCSACRDRLWKQERTTPQVTSTNPSTAPAWGGQQRTTGANPFDSNARVTTPGSQTPGTYDSNPGLRPASSFSGSPSTNLGSNAPATQNWSTPPATNLDRGTQPASRIPDDLGTAPQQTPMPAADTGRSSSSAQPAAPIGSTDQSSRWSTSNSVSSQTPPPQFPSTPSGSDSGMSSKSAPPLVAPAAKDGKYQMVYPSAPTTTSSDVKTLPAVPDGPDQ